MLDQGFAIVVDVGKTLSKVSLWSRDGRMLDRQTRPNAAVVVDGLRRLDVAGIAQFIMQALARHAGQPVEFIIPVSHGAGIVALGPDGPAFPPLDYEQTLPDAVMAEYRARRPGFAETGSPALPAGLNLGAQLFWLAQLDPGTLGNATLLPWAQFWAWHLSGTAVSEVTSLGCHSDLWNPAAGEFSSLARDMGWADRFAPLANAGDVIGTLRPEIAAATGLLTSTRVVAGLHDSNAALLAARGFRAIAQSEATVLSTGTWFIAMRLPAEEACCAALPEARDCLVNVDVRGRPVPSARFMGGREIESVIEIDTRQVDIRPDQPALLAAVPDLLTNDTMLLPTLAPGCGPFPAGEGRWLGNPRDWHARRAALCLYAALVGDTSLDLIGATGQVLVEGRFAEADVFVRALAALRPGDAIYTANAHNDVAFGALRLVDPALRAAGTLTRIVPLEGDLARYRANWRAAIAGAA